MSTPTERISAVTAFPGLAPTARHILYELAAEVTHREERIREVPTSMKAGAGEDYQTALLMFELALRATREWEAKG